MQALEPFTSLQLLMFNALSAGPHRIDALGKKLPASPAAINRALHGMHLAGIVDLQSRDGRLWAALVPGYTPPPDLPDSLIPACLLKPH